MRSKGFWLYAIFMFIHVVSLLYTTDTIAALDELKKKIPLFVLPLIIFSSDKLNQFQWLRFRQVFVVANLIMAWVILIMAVYNYFSGHLQHFFYLELLQFTTMHPAYLSLLFQFAIFFVLADENFFKIKWVNYFVVVSLCLFVLFLGSRMEMLTLLVLLSYFVVKKWISKKEENPFIKWGLPVLLIMVIALLFSVKSVRSRFAEITEVSYNTDLKKRYINSDNARIYMWQTAVQLFQEHKWIGVGMGSTPTLMKQKFTDDDFQAGLKSNFNNVHNQYLQFLVSFGIIGFSLLAVAYFYLGYLLFKSNQKDAFLLWIIFSMALLTECMLESQTGIVSFALFFPLILCVAKPFALSFK